MRQQRKVPRPPGKGQHRPRTPRSARARHNEHTKDPSMTTITASLVKELRDKTGAGMMDCKMALTEVKGDIEGAIDWLRKKGLSKAANKAGRVAAEGLVGVTAKGQAGAMVEVNSETDFVARNAQFQEMVRNITALAHSAGGDLERLLALTYPGTPVSVADHVKAMVATIG